MVIYLFSLQWIFTIYYLYHLVSGIEYFIYLLGADDFIPCVHIKLAT